MVNKKGMSIGTLFVFMAIGFAFLISLVVIMFFINQLTAVMLPVAHSLNTTHVDAVKAYQDTIGQIPAAYQSVHWISYGILLAMMISILISAAFSRKHPVTLVIFIFITIVAFIFSVPLSNTYQTLQANPALAPTFAGFTGSNWIFDYLPYVVMVLGIFGVILSAININRGQYS